MACHVLAPKSESRSYQKKKKKVRAGEVDLSRWNVLIQFFFLFLFSSSSSSSSSFFFFLGK